MTQADGNEGVRRAESRGILGAEGLGVAKGLDFGGGKEEASMVSRFLDWTPR